MPQGESNAVKQTVVETERNLVQGCRTVRLRDEMDMNKGKTPGVAGVFCPTDDVLFLDGTYSWHNFIASG